MKFHVRFTAFPSIAIKIDARPLGVSDVEKIVEKFKCDISLIRDESEERRENVLLPITLKDAKKTGLFEKTNLVEVRTPGGWLNQFTVEEPTEWVSNDEENEENEEEEFQPFGIGITLKVREVFQEWEKLGFPLEIKDDTAK